jgi:hypothetical protein
MKGEDWSMLENINKSYVLHSEKLRGLAVGCDVGLQYSYSLSKLLPILLIPFKKLKNEKK